VSGLGQSSSCFSGSSARGWDIRVSAERRGDADPVSLPACEGAHPLPRLLARAGACLGEFWTPDASLCARLSTLRDRLARQHLQLAVLGQLKRGKSTFLNALLGDALLPTGVVPLTAIPTFIAWAPDPRVRVTFLGEGRPEEFRDFTTDAIRMRLFEFVAEEANPQNRRGVARIDVFYPAEILEPGVVLIDTPGIGSIHRHNTERAFAVLPECDSALFVVSADPPITEAEIEYLRRAKAHIGRLFFVLNKIDHLEPGERETAIGFLRKALQDRLDLDLGTEIFPLSARRALAAKRRGDVDALEESGLAGIEGLLLRYLAREKTASLQAAIAGKAAALLAEATADLALRVRSLEMPLEDLERRSATFEDALARIERERLVARDLLAGDRRRAMELLEAAAERLRQAGRQHLLTIAGKAIAGADYRTAEERVRQTVAEAIPDFFKRQLGAVSDEFRQRIEDVLAGHRRRTDALVDLVRRTAADLFDIPFAAGQEAGSFKLGPEPYWVTRKWDEALAPLAGTLIDRLLPRRIREARLRRELEGHVGELVQRNVENLRWTTLQGLDATFRSFAAELDDRLAEAVEATNGAIKAALSERRDRSNRTDAALARLRRGAERLAGLRNEMLALAPGGER
jgi:GTP-binding protein EngB required for normal cell division